ncbi:MAG: RNA polymerase sigma factor [Saccharofermentanales bacterium]
MDDKKIIELYWERSETAIVETQVKYGRLFKHIAIHILYNNEDADECVNDTYLGAWNAIPPARPDPLSTFLCKITRNLALKKYEYNTAQKRNPHAVLPLSELENYISGTDYVENDSGHFEKVVSDFLRTLDYECRNVFIRRYWFCDSISDISERFHISESKAMSMLFRTRNKLKRYLKEEGISI